MKKITTPALMLLLATACLFSCKKDNGSDKSKTELLTQKGWIQTNSESGVGGVFSSDWSSYETWEKDDVTTFKTDKTYQITEGATKEDPTDSDLVDSGTWSFGADEKTLIMDGDAGTINTLDDNTLVVTFDLGGLSFRGTFRH